MKVSVVIANRNDSIMLAITVRSALEELKIVDSGEVVVVDNSDDNIYKVLGGILATGYINEGKLRLIRQEFPCLFTARQTAIEEARGEYVLCLDSHMIVGRDMIRDLVDFIDTHKHDADTGFAHAPINWLHQHETRSRHEMDLTQSAYGIWGQGYDHERPISWKGAPWICRRDWFLNELNGYGALARHRLAWGGGDFHIGCKTWLLGFKNWAVPCSPGIHIGPLAGKAKRRYRYRVYNESGEYTAGIGIMTSAYILGGEKLMLSLKERVDRPFIIQPDDPLWAKAIELGKDEKAWLDERKIMTVDEMLQNQPWNEANITN